ncbi:MAG: glycosyltransferase family 4 protein [Kiritimatiellales bacterium]|nr:glycosyltransferase family 4 protein [Kiritimatiellota bacterium]MBL7012491.1 glycosyltransferase family 4 protein [Kiritimatiellales bacterium]
MKTILIFEPLSGGHRANFIRWLSDAASEYTGCRFVFFMGEDVGDLQLETLSWWEKQKKLYNLFRQACEKYKPDHALILELTHLELPLILFGSPVPLSAILFVQYPELPRGLKRLLKHWKTRLLLWRVPIKNLFLLNGEKSCRFLTKHFSRRTRFIPVSDPAPESDADPEFAYNTPAGKRICLFFGAISRRKGADVLLDALERVRPETAQKNAFYFCGEPEAPYRDAFQEACERLRSARPDIHLIVENRFVPDNQMMAMFEQADLILMPYTRPEYSSGILALAARAGTPVLGPPSGLLGRLIRENGLGIAVELTPEAFERPVMLDEELCRKFVARNTVENFSKPILDAVCNEA